MKLKVVLFFVFGILLFSFTSAIPYILFVNPTPVDGYRTTSSGEVVINSTITNVSSLTEFIWNWDSVNYSLYDEDLVLMYNFENNSALGENDTRIVDLSRWGNNGSVINNSISVVNGKYGKGQSFIFENQSINITDSSMLHSSDLTISFWINLSTPKIKQLAANSWSSYILLENGDVYSFGYNNYGQLGDNTTTNRDIPVKVVGNFNFSQLARSDYPGENNGAAHMCGILTNGSTVCWGYNGNGRLGINSTVNKYRPTFIFGDYNFSVIHIGRYGSCGLLFNGTELCWGRTVYGALGDNTTTDGSKLIPTPVFGGYNFSYITMGDTMGCGIQQNGSALCWGRNLDTGAVGDNTTEPRYIPTPVYGNHNFSKIFGGNEKTCGLLHNGSLFCWGLQGSGGGEDFTCAGGLGINSCNNSLIPAPVYGVNLIFKEVESHYGGFCGILQNGSGMCWGSGTQGSGGDGTTEDRWAPTFINGNYNLTQISAGYGQVLGLTTNGTLVSWGKNTYNELGKGVNLNIIPLPIIFQHGNISDYKEITSSQTSCLILHNGSAMCWGNNANGKIGDNTTDDKDYPVFVSGNYNFSSMSFGGYLFNCGILQNGSAMCWGWNNYSQLGNGSTGDTYVPQLVIGGNIFTSIQTGGTYHTCGVTVNNTVMCWGRNQYGQLGIGNFTDMGAPILVAGNYNFSSFYFGGYHNCILLENGSAMCWGQNTYGQLGNGSLGNAYLPQFVLGGYNFSSLSLGNAHSCGLLHNGSAMCWGRNPYGQLGNGSIGGQSLVPVYVSGGYNFSSISVKGLNSCGLLYNRSLLCWGQNTYGQLGDGTKTNSGFPVFVQSGNYTFSSITPGSNCLGVLTDGRIVTWGDNQYGQQAITPSFNRKVPTAGSYKGNLFGKNPNSFEIISTFDNQARVFFKGQAIDIGLDKQYTHISLVINENNAKAYKEGELIEELNANFLSYYDDPANLVIGNNTLGVIDEVRVYNRSLSASEVNQLYRSNLKKVNNSAWEFYATESLNSGDKTYSYSLFALEGGTSFKVLRNIIKYSLSSEEEYPYSRLNILIQSQNSLKKGYSTNVIEKSKIEIPIEDSSDKIIIEIKEINPNTDKVIVSIENIEYEIALNESSKIDTNKDGFYDLEILNKKNYGTTSNLEFKSIHEAVPAEEQEEVIEEVEEEVANEEENIVEKKNNGKYFVIIGGIVLGVLIILLVYNKVKKDKRHKQFGY